MARITESNTEYESTTNSKYHSESTSKSESQSQSATRKVLDEVLRDRILSGLMGTMTDEEIDAYAENLLAPQRNAGLEAAQQKYDAAKLTGEQEIESLAAELARSITEQKRSYAQSAAVCRRRRFPAAWAEAATRWRRLPTRATDFHAR